MMASEEKRIPRRNSILLGERHTSIFSRFAAKAIDVLILVAVYLLGSAMSMILGITLAALYSAFMDGLGTGQSIGKRIMGLRVVEDATGLACSLRSSLLRNFPMTLAILFASLPILWALLILLALPILGLEIFLLLAVDSGTRLGDVLGNTLVIEYTEEAEYDGFS